MEKMEMCGRAVVCGGNDESVVAILDYATATVKVMRLSVKDDGDVKEQLKGMGYNSDEYSYMFGNDINFEFNL